MINPFDRSLDGQYEAKHQCMITNSVKIITDCSEYIRYVNEKYKDRIVEVLNKKSHFGNVVEYVILID